MKIAFFYDRVNKIGGAERVLLALHQIWPMAPLFTVVYDENRAKWARVFKIMQTRMKLLSYLGDNHQIYPLFTPYVFESFDTRQFDVVLSVTSSDAKSLITHPKTLHVCYCLTPARYLWSNWGEYLNQPGAGAINPLIRYGMKMFLPMMRKWDFISSSRPDHYIAISDIVAQRIKSYYKRESLVIYPPVDSDIFHPRVVGSRDPLRDYYLIVSRLVPYKRIDYAVSAFNRLGWKLVIIGQGIDYSRLSNLANDNIKFINSYLTDEKLCWYYQNCRALIFPGEEDFGITAVEAQACGKPVIAYMASGVKETVIAGVTGELYQEQNVESLIAALIISRQKEYDSSACRRNALKFSKKIFQRKMKESIFDLWYKY